MAKLNEKSRFLTFYEKNEWRKISIDRSERHVRVGRVLILLGLDDGFKPNWIASILRIDNKQYITCERDLNMNVLML